MFLSTSLLTDAERDEAFAEVPAMDALRLNRNIALNLVDNQLIDTIDALVGGFAREAFAAFLDGTHLALRACGQVAESKAAELYTARAEPRGWIVHADPPQSSDEGERLRWSLIQMPLDAAATILDAALNHFANAVIRFAWEAGFASEEVRALGLKVDQPATPERGWTSWGRVADSIAELASRSAPTSRFSLSQALLGCATSVDVAAVTEFRHRLVHRGMPLDLKALALPRVSGRLAGDIQLSWPVRSRPARPAFADTRKALSAALTACCRLEDAVISFLPKWARHLKLGLEIVGKDVTFTWSAQPSAVVVPPRIIYRPGGMADFTLQQYSRPEVRRREQRDHRLFEAGDLPHPGGT